MSAFQTIARTADIPNNKSQAVDLAGLKLLVCNSGGDFFVVENRCSHQDEPLTLGRIRNGTIICPVHGMRYKLESGEPVGRLTRIPIRQFESRIVQGQVQVRLDDAPPQDH